MNSNAVEATVVEMNAATRIARAFLLGAQVTEQTPWRPEHGRLASAALVEWIGQKQSAAPVRETPEIEQIKWPDPPEVSYTTAPTNRYRITKSAEFVRGHPYSGWTRGIYGTCSFDAYSTEFRLAELFDDGGSAVKAWARVTTTVPLTIAYRSGAGTRSYVPDFIVIDDQRTHWIVEGKRDDEMTDTVVLAKRDAAAAWVATVNNGVEVQETWAYLLVSEAVIKNASSWQALKSAGQAFQ
jgi:type III restriction enzyme